jgi:cystathionine beta-lyase/cystathionine gamma-synthase
MSVSFYCRRIFSKCTTSTIAMAMTTSTTVHNNSMIQMQRQRDHQKLFSSSTTMTKEEAGRKAAQLATSVAGAVDDRQRRRLLQLDDDDDDDDSKDNATTIAMATILSHAGITTSCDGGGERENHPMSPPLHTATTYTRPPDGIYKDSDSIYSRMDNPTRLLLENNIFDLECTNLLYKYRSKDGDDEKKRNDDDNGTRIPLLPLCTTTCYSSGMQAVTSILLAHSSSPTNMTVLIPTDVYHGVRSLLSGVFSRHGMNVREINMSSDGNEEDDEDSGEIAIANTISEIAIATTAVLASPTTVTTTINNSDIDDDNGDHNHDHDLHNIVVWMETPSNPKCEVVDIKTVCDKVRSVGERWKNIIKITTVVDGTMSSPVLTRPLEVC